MDLSVIIVNWNTKDLLAGCLRSLFATVRNLELEVILLDNASTDGSADMVRTRFPQVKLIQSQENVGFARGNNVALTHAMGQYVLLLNPDTVVLDGAIEQLYQALQTFPRLGAAGAQLLNADGSCQPSWGHFPSLWTEVPGVNRLKSSAPEALEYNLLQNTKSSVLSVDWVSGACLMIRRKAMDQVGLLDEDYWLYTEEADWCFRAQKAGWKIGWLPTAQIVHKARAASRQRYTETMIHFHRSRLLFLLKHRGRTQAFVVQAVLCLKAITWMVTPAISPLSQSFPDLSPTAVKQAHRMLLKRMLAPLGQRL
jgi:N-acetylglucosaminyl-diphospho-decaprenol L-rhamnosyltransferase